MKTKIYALDKPTAKIVSILDIYLQDIDEEEADRIGKKYYYGSIGWEGVSKSNLKKAFQEFKLLQQSHDITDSIILNS